MSAWTRFLKYTAGCALAGLLGCMQTPEPLPANPSKNYADHIRTMMGSMDAPRRAAHAREAPFPESVMPLGRLTTLNDGARARVQFVSDELPPEASGPGRGLLSDELPRHVPPKADREVVTNEGASADPGFYTYRGSLSENRDYSGPLNVGEPGETASLWRESRGGTDLWRDSRAWQSMDLITIVIRESDEAKKDADTEVKQKSTVELAIDKLFGLENQVAKANDGTSSGIDPSALVQASSQNDFKGEGKAKRKDTLSARMSAMVVEVLPSGIMRIEGQKIVTMSAEEQVMVISGLVRPRDVSAENEVESGRIANMRVDYYGRGTVGEAQHGGWLGRILRTAWPF